VSLLPPETVGKLQQALHGKAKRLPDYRFYALYDKVYREDVLWHAHRICQLNGGAPGVDGQTFADIEEYGQKQWLGELAECPVKAPLVVVSQAQSAGSGLFTIP
jgi:RNA-directed DNA polymerase